jgi:hypothetical protein
MVRIEFDEHSKATHRSDIRQKRKLMTTSEKFYNRKKQHYSSYIKETHQKNAATNHDHCFLTVGSHAIRKMDYTTINFNQNIKYLEENVEMKRRLKDNFNISDVRSIFLDHSTDYSKVLVLKKNERQHRLENQLYPYT